MTGIIGMNPEQVRELARLLDTSSRALDLTASTIGTAVRTTSWVGGDAEQFRHSWSSRHAPVLRQVGSALHEIARVALADADQQEDVSSLATAVGGLSGSGSGGPGGDTPGNPFTDLWGEATETFDDAIDTLGDGVTQIGDWAEDGIAWVGGRLDGGAEATEEEIDRLVELAGGLFDDEGGGPLDWASDRVDDAGGFIADGVRELPREVAESAPDVWEDLQNFGGLFAQGEPPSITEVVAGGTLLLGSAGNLAYRAATVGQDDPHFLDDGEAEAGEPIPLRVGSPGATPDDDDDGHRPAVVPDSLAAIARSTAAAYSDASEDGVSDGGVRITTVDGPDGPSYIVSIPGTQDWAPGGSTPADLTGNLEVASGQSSTASEAVRLAMLEAGVPSDAPVLLSGHSQGGMIAMELAGDAGFREQFDVTNVMTFGSPVDTAHVPYDIDVVAFQHTTDAVPHVDLGGVTVTGGVTVPPNAAAVVTLPNPEDSSWYDLGGNHDYNAYVASIAEAEAEGGQAGAYGRNSSFGQFMTDDPSAVTGVVVPISRSH